MGRASIRADKTCLKPNFFKEQNLFTSESQPRAQVTAYVRNVPSTSLMLATHRLHKGHVCGGEDAALACHDDASGLDLHATGGLPLMNVDI